MSNNSGMIKSSIGNKWHNGNAKLRLCGTRQKCTFNKILNPRTQSFPNHCYRPNLTHWGRVTHICVRKLSIIGSDNGLSPGRHQAIIWTNDGILWNCEIVIKIQTFSYKKMHMKTSSAKWCQFCLGLNVLQAKHTCWDPIDLWFVWWCLTKSVWCTTPKHLMTACMWPDV